MVAIIYSILWILVAVKLADRKWQRYYPTMLFAAIGNLLYELICYEYQLWQMEPNGLPLALIPMLLLIMIGMPILTWVYLSWYPTGRGLLARAGYILLFTAIFVLLEYISVKCGSITYHNGWNLLWSLFFDIVMFIILRIHYRKPLIALILSLFYIGFLIIWFDVPFEKMK
ncbi:CBO0543 family protein [Paenibacillus prosopidis]|uniref:Uncharacterized protein n=1 Tax=Paenibacillus prosopidis TaxID=630520 RepID=A0A368VXF7_9BACL|nr:CBO0543 family protein [Paenibacillus prosopidis]RCW46596.1 hypothetical protein DFP97_109247 [Paenibacillus prosopidis]